jgi:hypothetical protein
MANPGHFRQRFLDRCRKIAERMKKHQASAK